MLALIQPWQQYNKQLLIPTARQYIRSFLHHSTTCWRHGGKLYYATPDLLPLPQIWTCDSLPFTITGIKISLEHFTFIRKVQITECTYACLPVPQVTQFILKLWLIMNSGDFSFGIQKIHKLEISAKTAVSDNASTYLATTDKLQRLLQSDHLTELLGIRGVLWCFIPKHAP